MTHNEFLNVVFDDLGYCGCMPDHILTLISNKLISSDKIVVFDEDKVDELLLSMLLGSAKLIEHGGGHRNSWLTQKGIEFKEFIMSNSDWLQKIDAGI